MSDEWRGVNVGARIILGLIFLFASTVVNAQQSVARQWNEQALEAIRHDYARPTVHARNLFHTSAAMWDAWAAYDSVADGWLVREKSAVGDVQSARNEAMSFAAYRLLSWRFAHSPGADTSLPAFTSLMQSLGYDIGNQSVDGDSPAALGNRIAAAYIEFGLSDGSNEGADYVNRHYESINPPLVPALPGNPSVLDPNRYQPLALTYFVDQSGNVIPGGFPEFLSAEWGQVVPFSLTSADLTIRRRDGFDYWMYHDPGPPPQLGGAGDLDYKANFENVVRLSGLLDPGIGQNIDISPASLGNNTLGTNDGHGYAVNPVTGVAYTPQLVPAGDYYRVLAEFWADGPHSETPPGHWFTIANTVSDSPHVVKRIGGTGPLLDDLEWDIKLYFALAGAMHDSAISAWGIKGWYDYVRPVSAIRHLAGLGQSSDPNLPSYNAAGIHLYPGEIELITEQSIAPGERHEHLAGPGNNNIGKIAVFAWRGPDYITDPATDSAGVGWILGENWWPYQRPTFVTPPFAGYVSGHSTYSRAAAALLSGFTGSEYFPGGLGQFEAPQNQFLVFEQGPSVDITLEWARYYDAADECSLSRIYGGIHPSADDIPGRLIGAVIGPEALARAMLHYRGAAPPIGVILAPPVAVPAQSPISLIALFAGLAMLGAIAARRRIT